MNTIPFKPLSLDDLTINGLKVIDGLFYIGYCEDTLVGQSYEILHLADLETNEEYPALALNLYNAFHVGHRGTLSFIHTWNAQDTEFENNLINLVNDWGNIEYFPALSIAEMNLTLDLENRTVTSTLDFEAGKEYILENPGWYEVSRPWVIYSPNKVDMTIAENNTEFMCVTTTANTNLIWYKSVFPSSTEVTISKTDFDENITALYVFFLSNDQLVNGILCKQWEPNLVESSSITFTTTETTTIVVGYV